MSANRGIHMDDILRAARSMPVPPSAIRAEARSPEVRAQGITRRRS